MIHVETIARHAHEANKQFCEAHGDHSQVSWDDAPENIKQSAIDGVQFVVDNPDATPESIHANWVKFKLADGWVHGEVKDAEQKTHPCITEYKNLPELQRHKDTIFISIVKGYLSSEI